MPEQGPRRGALGRRATCRQPGPASQQGTQGNEGRRQEGKEQEKKKEGGGGPATHQQEGVGGGGTSRGSGELLRRGARGLLRTRPPLAACGPRATHQRHAQALLLRPLSTSSSPQELYG